MISERPRNKIGDYFTLQRGTTYKSKLLGNQGPILLGLSTIQRNGGFRYDSLQTYGGESPDKLLVHPGELYLSLKDVTQSADLLGAVSRLPCDMPIGRLTQDTVKLKPKSEDVPLNYLYWLLRTPNYRNYCRAHATGTTNLGLSREDFLAYPAPEPTIDHLKIVETLEALESKIILNQRKNITLKKIGHLIFRHWFLDFEFPNEEGKPYKSSDGEMVDSELGETPKGWKIDSLGNHMDFVKGRKPTNTSEKKIKGYLPQILIKVLDSKTPNYADPKNLVLINKDDIIMVMDGASSGRIEVGFEGIVGSTLAKIVLKTNDINNEYLYQFLSSIKEEIKDNTTGTAIPHTDKPRIFLTNFVVPDKLILIKYKEYMQVLNEKIFLDKEENKTLTQIRDSLLPKLMSGEARVSDHEGENS